MRVPQRFTEHPASVGETYTEHFRMATRFAGALARASVCCLVHALYPPAFTTTGSDAIEALHREMSARRGDRVATIGGSAASTAEPLASDTAATAG